MGDVDLDKEEERMQADRDEREARERELALLEQEREEAMTDLRECPFCGGKAEIDEVYTGNAWPSYVQKVSCQECGASPDSTDNMDADIDAWNTRPEEDRLRGEVERLQTREDKRRALDQAFKDLLEKQEPLGEEAERVWFDNIEKLYKS